MKREKKAAPIKKREISPEEKDAIEARHGENWGQGASVLRKENAVQIMQEGEVMACDCKNCIVRGLTIFSGLGISELEKVGTLIYLKSFRRKKVIFLEDTPSNTVYVLKTGTVKCYKSLPDGRELIISILTPGDMLGFDSLYEDHYSNTAEAIQDTELCCIRKKDLVDLLQEQPRGRRPVHQEDEQGASTRAGAHPGPGPEGRA